MLTFDIFTVTGIMVASIIAGFFAGYSTRKYRTNKAIEHSGELEKEMLNSHSEILQLQKDNLDLLKVIDELKISLNAQNVSANNETGQAVVDISSRKKIFQKDIASSGGKGID